MISVVLGSLPLLPKDEMCNRKPLRESLIGLDSHYDPGHYKQYSVSVFTGIERKQLQH